MNRIFILDRSGSMESCIDDTIGGFNSFVRDQKSLGGTLSLFLFDHELLKLYDNMDIYSVENLTNNTYVPHGSTALFDAIGSVLTTMELNDKTTVIILTDGCENSSVHYSKKAVKDLVDMNTKNGVTFLYLGANHDAFEEGESLGFKKQNVMNFSQRETADAFHSASTCIRHRSTGDYNTPLKHKFL